MLKLNTLIESKLKIAALLISLVLVLLPFTHAYVAAQSAPEWPNELTALLTIDPYANNLYNTTHAEEWELIRTMPDFAPAVVLSIIQSIDLLILKPLKAGLNIDVRSLMRTILERAIPGWGGRLATWAFHAEELITYVESRGTWQNVGTWQQKYVLNADARWELKRIEQAGAGL